MSSLSTLRLQLTRYVGRAGVVAFASQAVAGCYTRQPVDGGAVQPGAVVVAAVSDRGRVDLNGTLGESPSTVEGRLTARTDSTLTLAVSQVESLRGGQTKWAGERVTLRLANIAYMQTKRLDRARTALAAAAGVAAVVAAVVGVSLAVGNRNGGGDGPPGGGGTGGQSRVP